MQTTTVSKIDVFTESTWENTVALTFDLDWAVDELLNDTIDLVEQADVAATWFVTHNTPVLRRLRANSKFELGIHPNFNNLLEGDHGNGKNAVEVIDQVMAIVPEATSIRSHSMTQSSRLLELFKHAGLTHDVNHFIPHHSGIELRPWVLWNGLQRIPYSWEDDLHCAYGTGEKMSSLIAGSGLKVFAFHPIHVFLNTESLDRYERTRHVHQDPKELIKYRCAGYGCRNLLSDFLDLCSR